MPTPREELERLRGLSAQQGGQVTAPAADQETKTALTPKQELEKLRSLSQQGVDNGNIGPDSTVVPTVQPVGGLDSPVNLAGEVPERPVESSIFDKALGNIEATISMGSGMIAEPIAGIAGIGGALKSADTGVANIDAVRELLTFVPRTEEGLKALQNVQALVEPVAEVLGKAEKGAGELGFETGGPLSGAVASTIPTALLSVIGIGQTKNLLSGTSKKVLTPSSKKILRDAAPTTDGIKEAARVIYKEIDDSGAVIKGETVKALSDNLSSSIRKEGFNARIHPKIAAALDEFEKVSGTNQSVSSIDTLRRVSQAAARSLDPDEARLGVMMIEKIDDALDTVKPTDLVGGKGANIGAKYKDARSLWGMAKKSELLEEAFSKAQLQASGFENGLRTQFRTILNSKKKTRGFTNDELIAMRRVVNGGPVENIAKALGRFGFTEGQATSMLMGSAGVAGGAALGGAPGAVAVPLIGQVSKTLAQKLTRNNAELAKQVVRSGKNGKEIANSYFKSVPKESWSAPELSELLLRGNVNIPKLRSSFKSLPKDKRKLAVDAVFFADFLKSQENNTQEESQ